MLRGLFRTSLPDLDYLLLREQLICAIDIIYQRDSLLITKSSAADKILDSGTVPGGQQSMRNLIILTPSQISFSSTKNSFVLDFLRFLNSLSKFGLLMRFS